MRRDRVHTDAAASHLHRCKSRRKLGVDGRCCRIRSSRGLQRTPGQTVVLKPFTPAELADGVARAAEGS